jgi:hypothetical protein
MASSTMTMFDFMNSNSEYNYTIHENLILKIKYNTPSVALLYFADTNNNKVNIPNEFKIYTFDFQKNKKSYSKTS